jgi:hypothetical protein
VYGSNVIVNSPHNLVFLKFNDTQRLNQSKNKRGKHIKNCIVWKRVNGRNLNWNSSVVIKEVFFLFFLKKTLNYNS